MNVEVYEYGGLGYIIDPESDTKIRTVILIGKQEVKCNPRPAVIYLSAQTIDKEYSGIEKLKEYCADHKVVFVCPKDQSIDTLEATYKYLFKNHLELNVLRDQISICAADESSVQAAETFQTYLLEEYDVEAEKILL